jgi:hypothetical protein
VNEDLVVFKRLQQSDRYDHATITLPVRPGKLIDLDQLFESVWATRLSGGTRSGLVSLEVTAVGEVVAGDEQTVLKVAGAEAEFVLAKNPDKGSEGVFDDLRAALGRGERVTQVTGRLDGWSGRWPTFLRELPPKPRRILVSSFETAKKP